MENKLRVRVARVLICDIICKCILYAFCIFLNPKNISSNQPWAPLLYTVTIHHSLCKGQGLHFNTLGTSLWNVKDLLLSLCYWHHGWLNGRPSEPVWYRIRLAFSYLIKHARPFDIDMVAPSGPQRVRQAFLVFNMIHCMLCKKKKKVAVASCWQHKQTSLRMRHQQILPLYLIEVCIRQVHLPIASVSNLKIWQVVMGLEQTR